MSLFEEHILDPVKAGLDKPDAGIPIPMTKLSKYTNYIEKGKIIAVGGRPDSGKTSLADYAYFISVFDWWRKLGYTQDEDGDYTIPPPPSFVKPKIKFFYFNMKSNARLKIQKWLCLYLKMEFDMVIDIPTLNSGIGRLYDLDQNDKDRIESAFEFFDELEENMTMVNGSQAPSSIYNKVRRYMDGIGTIEEGVYKLNPDYQGQITMVLVDNTDKLATEADDYHVMNGDALKRKLAEYLGIFAKTYNVTSVVIVPSKASNSRMVKDTEPSYKDLGVFNDIADVGLVTYNPYDENNNKYLNYPLEELVVKGKNRFRTITIVRNKTGISNITVGGVFLGECGYFRESPHPLETEDWDNIFDLLQDLP